MEYQQYPQNTRETNGKAIASMVLGILAIIIPYVGFILGIIAIVLSRKAVKEMNVSGQAGKGMATAGLVCGIIGTAIYALIIVILVIIGIFASAMY